MEGLDVYNYIMLKQKIKEEKKPILIQRNNGKKVAIVLTPEARIFYNKRGFQAFVLDELFNVLLQYETKEEQKKVIEDLLSITDVFSGQIQKLSHL